MDLFEPFMHDILQTANYQSVEGICEKMFQDNVLKQIYNPPQPNFNYTINMHDILVQTYDDLQKENIQIVCLVFTNKNIMYWDKKVLEQIGFFKNYFEFNQNNLTIFEMEDTGIIDNYDMMLYVKEFCDVGHLQIDKYDYNTLHELAKINGYLLDTKSPYGFESLHAYMNSTIKLVIECMEVYCNNDFCYEEGCFDIIYETCVMVGFKREIEIKKNGIFKKYQNEFLESKLSGMGVVYVM